MAGSEEDSRGVFLNLVNPKVYVAGDCRHHAVRES